MQDSIQDPRRCSVPARVTPPAWLPYGHLHLWRNPFGELPWEDRIAAAEVDVTRWLPVLSRPKTAVQFMGDCGRGKTTHLLALLKYAPQAAYVYLPEAQPHPPIPTTSPLFVDEAQRLGWRIRRRVWQRGQPLILGTHLDLTRSLQRFGYDVETVTVSQQVSEEQLGRIFRQRIEMAALGTGPVPDISSARIHSLMDAHGTNIRAMLETLYDVFETLKGSGDGKL